MLLPTVVINNRQYRGHLDAVSITKALCSAFDETTEPEVCLTDNSGAHSGASYGRSYDTALCRHQLAFSVRKQAWLEVVTAMQVCLTGNIQQDDCASGSQSCWRNETLNGDACIDTYRGYKCQCPEGDPSQLPSWHLFKLLTACC